jgi:hypothetical protein
MLGELAVGGYFELFLGMARHQSLYKNDAANYMCMVGLDWTEMD